jgi:hypothetical protein
MEVVRGRPGRRSAADREGAVLELMSGKASVDQLTRSPLTMTLPPSLVFGTMMRRAQVMPTKLRTTTTNRLTIVILRTAQRVD